METCTKYDEQAAAFLARFGLSIKIELQTPETCPPFADTPATRGPNACRRCGTVHGRKYLVTLDPGRRDAPLRFAYWGAHADRPGQPVTVNGQRLGLNERDISGSLKNKGKHPSAYDVLASLGGDASLPNNPNEVAAQYGPMKQSRACCAIAWAQELRDFFTASELEALEKIQ